MSEKAKSKRKEKGDFGYLRYKKRVNMILTICSYAMVFTVFLIGLLIARDRNNISTVVAIVLCLPAAKVTVGYGILLSHQSAPVELMDKLKACVGELPVYYDLIFSNRKSPIGTLAVVVDDSTVIAYTTEEKADAALFEASLKQFMENDNIHVTVTMYKDEKAFLKRAGVLSANFDSTKEINYQKIKRNTESLMSMCL